MKIDDYRRIVHDDIAVACDLNSSKASEEFLAYATSLLINGEEFDDFVECHCEGGTLGSVGFYCIDGYSIDETDGSCCVFIVDYHGPNAVENIIAKDIELAFNKIRRFVEKSIKSELFREIQNRSAMEFSRDCLNYDAENITKFRFYLLTDAFNRQRAKTIKDETINGRIVELNVWDIERLYDLVCSQMQKEVVEIKFEDFGIDGIPCVKAVEHVDVVADIDVSPILNEDEGSTPENIITYSSYLAVVPGKVLNRLYLDYGSKLLEGNVRSFLSAKRKVNKGIQNTIKNYPEMFFAYNNGIAATATEIEVKYSQTGPVISYIKGLQIVNGGQTTASIANTLLTAKKGDNVDLTKVAVPMKLSVLEHSMAERIIPKISEYSNSQNPVDASDFFSNHPFHIRMEEYSRKTPIPAKGGNQFQQYWFYERARGQYNQGKMKIINRAAELKKYTDRYPESMVITMLDLARYMELYGCRPDIVSKGKQKLLQRFAEEIKASWEKGDTQYNEFYFKRAVALAIIYKKTDEIIKQSAWYRENRSYKANVNAYTISIIFNHIRKKYRNYELDFKRIWNEQDIYEELEEQITVLQNEVHNFITGPRSTENVTEWCKKELCWTCAQEQVWTMNHAFLATLVSKEEVEEERKEQRQTQKIANEVNALKEIYTRGPQYWSKVLEWGMSRRMLSEKEVSILKLSVNMFVTGRIISDKQAQVVISARKKLIENGMPMQF